MREIWISSRGVVCSNSAAKSMAPPQDRGHASSVSAAAELVREVALQHVAIPAIRDRLFYRDNVTAHLDWQSADRIVERHCAATAEAGVEIAVGVEPGQAAKDRLCVIDQAADHHLPIGLHRDGLPNARRVAAKGYFGGSEGSALDAGFAVSRFFTNSGRMVSEFPIMFFAVNRDLPESARPRLTDTTRAEVQRLRKADSGICFDSHRLQRRGGATGVQNLQIHHRSHRVGRYRQGRNPQGLH